MNRKEYEGRQLLKKIGDSYYLLIPVDFRRVLGIGDGVEPIPQLHMSDGEQVKLIFSWEKKDLRFDEAGYKEL